MSADQEKIKNQPSPETNLPKLEVEKQQIETTVDTKTDLSSLRTAVEGSSAATETASSLVSEHSESDQKENLTTFQTVDSTKLEEEKIVSELADKYNLEIKEIIENPEQLRNILAEADILEIRSNAKILWNKLYPNQNPEENEIIKKETARRIKAYTSGEATKLGWYTLNYKQVNESHEMQVGLGEILLDPSIKEIEVIRGGRKIKGTRAVIKNRICFADENGSYIDTYTGDKFRIKTNDILNKEELEKSINKENDNRLKYKEQETIRENSTNETNYLNQDAIYADPKSKETPGNVPLNTDLVIKAQKASEERTRINNFEDLEAQNPNLAYLIRHICKHFNVPEPIIYATLQTESNFRHGAIGDLDKPNSSIGIGQFQPATFDGIQRQPEFQNFISQYYPNQKFQRGENIMADITATVLKTKKDAEKKNININQPLSSRDILFLRGKYTGFHGGYKNYMKNVDHYLKTGEDLIYDGKDKRYSKFLNLVRKYEYQYIGIKPKNEFDTPSNENLWTNDKERTKGTPERPYRYASIIEGVLSNGGGIGFTEGTSQGNDINSSERRAIALSQLKAFEKQGVKEIISLVNRNDLEKLIKNEGINIKIATDIPNAINTSSETPTENHRLIIGKIANNIRNNINTYVHCRHGTHRAIITTTLALIQAGKTKDLMQALSMAKGNLSRFYSKTEHVPFLKMAVAYAKELGAINTAGFEKRIEEIKSST